MGLVIFYGEKEFTRYKELNIFFRVKVKNSG